MNQSSGKLFLKEVNLLHNSLVAMRVIIFIAVLAFCGLAKAQITERWVSLRLDHFNPLDRRTYDAKYFINQQHFVPNAPIFIYISGGFGAYDDFLASGAVFEMAEETGGLLLGLEHRYYGDSRPTPDASTDNLRWLTIHQALADLAQFINFVKANYAGAANSRVILWGRFYGGSLAVWARQKYPNLIDGVWASSATIDGVLEYPQFMRNVYTTINNIGGPECGNVLRAAYTMMDDAIRRRDTLNIEQRLRLCSPIDIDVEEDITRFFYQMTAEIGYSFGKFLFSLNCPRLLNYFQIKS